MARYIQLHLLFVLALHCTQWRIDGNIVSELKELMNDVFTENLESSVEIDKDHLKKKILNVATYQIYTYLHLCLIEYQMQKNPIGIILG